MSKPPPLSVPIDAALASCEALGRLTERLREAQARLAIVQRALPPLLRAQVRSGTLDADGWTLLVPNGAVSAKLRQLMPVVEAELTRDGWPALPLRVRILPPDAATGR